MSSPFFTFASALCLNYIFVTELSGSSSHIQIWPGSWPETMDKWLSGGGVTTLPLLYGGQVGDVNTFSDMYFLSERGWPLARPFVGVQLGACVWIWWDAWVLEGTPLCERVFFFYFLNTMGLSGLLDGKFSDLCIDICGQVFRAFYIYFFILRTTIRFWSTFITSLLWCKNQWFKIHRNQEITSWHHI